jgi:dUTP pyrophosphatase
VTDQILPPYTEISVGPMVPIFSDAPQLLALRTDGQPGPAFQQPPYAGDAGLDLALSEDVTIGPEGTVNAGTGVAVALPPGTFGWITGRSSTWARHGLIVMPGIIDEGWRGELRVLVYRPGHRRLGQVQPSSRDRAPLHLEKGTRIAQLIVLPAILGSMQLVNLPLGEALPPGSRGEQGFGSSGN